ncbi:MAG: 16S rRNA (adenine(1518)-N(6)/adenine(1519)-N(6))-dimethyltransferase, partial [Saprospiraceae bacterium]|nr:16S rRNA (adenine(1518)-N(6)/adenine(1519)-N(6))-dimethyltransferase [Saprospiraceae bacterium]
MRAKKSYGQHFLRHPEIARRIAYSLTAEDVQSNVLEVGPGKGILTQFVAERYPGFKAIDADPDMIAFLQKAHPQWTDHLVLGDFLQLDLPALFNG